MKKTKKLVLCAVLALAVCLVGVLGYVGFSKRTTTETVKLTYGSRQTVGGGSSSYNTAAQSDFFSLGSSKGVNYMTESAAADTAAYAENSYDTAVAEDAETDTGAAALTDNKKLRKTYNYRVESTEYDKYINDVEKAVESLGGYIEDRSEDTYTADTSDLLKTYTVRRMDYTMRVPADKVQELQRIVENGVFILSQNEYVEDVTTQYIDLDTHIQALKTEYSYLEELLAQAVSVTEIMEVQDRLTEINYEVESYEKTLDALKKDIDYSKLYLTVNEVIYYQDTVTRYTSELAESWAMILQEWLEEILPVIVLVILPIIILACVGIYLVIRAAGKARVKHPQVLVLRREEDNSGKEQAGEGNNSEEKNKA